MLAPSLAFSDFEHIIRKRFDRNRPPFTMTNRGLRMELLLSEELSVYVREFLVGLNCAKEDHQLGIRIRRIYNDQFLRIPSETHLFADCENNAPEDRIPIYVKERTLQ